MPFSLMSDIDICAAIEPLSIIPIVSAILPNSSKIWLDIKMLVWYSRLIFCSAFRISIIPCRSRPFMGSSKISSSGLVRNALASARRYFIPSEKFLTGLFSTFESPKSDKVSSIALYPPPIYPQ